MNTIIHRRDHYNNNSTIGKIFYNNRHICDTKEATARAYGVKVKDRTAIPPNKDGYIVEIDNTDSVRGKMIRLRSDHLELHLSHSGILFTFVKILPISESNDNACRGNIYIISKCDSLRMEDVKNQKDESGETYKNLIKVIEENNITKWVIVNII